MDNEAGPQGRKILSHGSPDAPIPVAIGVKQGVFERSYITSCLKRMGHDPQRMRAYRSQLVHKGRKIHRRVAKADDGTEKVFYFDVTLRKQRPVVPGEIHISDDAIHKLRNRVGELPDRGCFLCRWILDLGSGGQVKKTGDFDLLGKIRHLHVEGIADFEIPCSQCGIALPGHSAYEREDVSICIPCDAILKVTDALHKERLGPDPEKDPDAVFRAVHYPRK